MLVAFASLSGPIVDLATKIIKSLGYAGVAAMTATSGVIGVPGTEPAMLFGGFSLGLAGVIVAGVIGDMIGATIAYSIGYFGSHELLVHQGGKLHVKKSSLERAHRWFEQRGTWVIFVSRLLPFIRAGFPYAAGAARVPYPRFAALATAGSVIWIGALGIVGHAVGSQWKTWRNHLEYLDYAAVAMVVIGIAYLLFRRRNANGRGSQIGDDPGTEPAASVDVL